MNISYEWNLCKIIKNCLLFYIGYNMFKNEKRNSTLFNGSSPGCIKAKEGLLSKKLLKISIADRKCHFLHSR